MGRTPNNSDVNTLLNTYDAIVASPEDRRYAIVEYTTVDINTPVHGGDPVPRIEVTHWEDMVGHLGDQAVKLLDEAFTHRTGQAARPGPGAAADTPLDLSSITTE